MTHTLGLCEGRHPIPGVSLFVFGQEIPSSLLTSPVDLEEEALASLRSLGVSEGDSMCLYATGLSVALLAVLSAAHRMGVPTTVYHYNRDNGMYYPQSLSWVAR